jgi:phosphoheptose isomerase
LKPENFLDDLIARYCKFDDIKQSILFAYEIIASSFACGGRLYVCGNGGSAADIWPQAIGPRVKQ